jgi:GrpB-like predicted nucleotidyltransferase (UPF0157 family)
MQKDEKILIIPYDSSWPKKFEKEKELLEKTIKDWIVGGIYHVGSTAVPGLSAKPIIDIMVGVRNLEEAKACIPLLEKIEYYYYPYKPEQMIWFCKPSPYKREFHLHLIPYESKLWRERLVFRDYLRKHADAKEEYQRLKIKLADKFTDDREAYTDAKSEFVNSILQKALK